VPLAPLELTLKLALPPDTTGAAATWSITKAAALTFQLNAVLALPPWPVVDLHRDREAADRRDRAVIDPLAALMLSPFGKPVASRQAYRRRVAGADTRTTPPARHVVSVGDRAIEGARSDRHGLLRAAVGKS